MMRVGVALMYHETNTFADASTGRTRYERFDVWNGDELVNHWAGSRTAPAGMFETLSDLGADAVPLYGAFAQPSGTIESDAYARLREELFGALKDSLPLDAVALALHGAAVADGVDDVEGDLVRDIRTIVGADVPIVGSFDLHGNLTQEMADLLDGFFGFRLYPHEDMYESGAEAVRLIPGLLERRVQPVTHIEHVPVLLPPSTTDNYPAAEVNHLCEEIERDPAVIDCTFFHGFPYADVPQVGASVVAISDGDREVARSAARQVASWIWEHREDFRAVDPPAAEALARALAAPDKPIVINETSDNNGGGAPGDGTHLLRAMVDAGVANSCFASIYDPETAAQAHAAGVGATLEVELGGKHDDLHGKPLSATAYVKSLTDGRFSLTAFAPGMKMDLGPSARLQIGGIDVIVASAQSQVFDPQIFLLHGIDVTRCDVVALKSSAHFRAGFRDLAKEIITADTPGVTTSHVEVFDRKRNAVPLWPIDQAARYPAT